MREFKKMYTFENVKYSMSGSLTSYIPAHIPQVRAASFRI
ncbi:hypothetical protein BTN50_1924 [Candidatus Enterovibrio altilux]|uniref:Uncharacterized protein n=1 Tax=Candidatus Enterovibrio altilux TaxID=1927128 RepID=A0A291BBF4_9GAMM|nr:hypothetical protein BTN50_1924 [Candidatus Enterovibrio luxaltus]